MTSRHTLAILREVQRDLSVLPPATWEEAAHLEHQMKRAGLSAELWELQQATRVAPEVPMYEHYRFGFDEWHAGPDELRAFAAACRRLLAGG